VTIDALRKLVFDLNAKATVLAALNAEMRARATGVKLNVVVEKHVDELLQQAGVGDALSGISPEELRPLAAELRHFWLLAHALMLAPDAAPGWKHRDNATLSSSGEVTEGFPNALAAKIASQLDGLPAKLESGAAFLDVGTGVGRLAIAMAKRFPKLRVTGIDTWQPALAFARDNVRAAGVEDRIDLREQAGEAMTDEKVFDLAWVPAPFVSADALPPLLSTVLRALKPGGWLLFVTTMPGDDLFGAAMRLYVSMFGGENLSTADIEALLTKRGFAEVRRLPGPPGDFKCLFAARRPL
jgi:SAM-dependent methyltransferase